MRARRLGARVRRGGSPRPRPPAFRGRRDNPSGGHGGGRAGESGAASRPHRHSQPVSQRGQAGSQAAATRPRCSSPPSPPARGGDGPPSARPPQSERRPAGPPARLFPGRRPGARRSGRDYAKMVLQARNKHREAAPRAPQPPRASQSPLRGAPDLGAGEPGPERAPPSPARKGAAGRKGPRTEPAAPPAGGGLRGRLAAGLRGALGLRRAGRGRTWTTLLLGEQPRAPGRGTLRRGPLLPRLFSPASAARSPTGRSSAVGRASATFFPGPSYLFFLLPFPFRLYPPR